ncbi:RHS repeat-associated core domain-containing protein [Erwinia amylovora]|uniref:RHS repeat-associated core domain-containing protein n=1 Tax=Erwinia amylovora TaxID=552 RepID=UPI0035C7608B
MVGERSSRTPQRRTRYIYGEGGWEPLARVDSVGDPGEVFWYHTELNGLPERMTDEYGERVWQGRFSAWGEAEHESSPRGLRQNLRFQGQYFDAETGLHYNLYRYYDPVGGRFTQTDPIGLAGGLNLYAYAPNPLSWVDPLGLSKCQAGKNDSAHNAANRQKLNDYYTQSEKYGAGGVKELQNGRYRFYDVVKPSRNPGEMKGARLVREWDPASGNKRTWYETVDHSGNIRSVAPKPVTHAKNHHIFDIDGNYLGRR